MPRRNLTKEVSAYIRGINTEASPLVFPENASLDESNFTLLRDGSRKRRLGIDYEENFTKIIRNGITLRASGDIAFSSYRWENVSGDAKNVILVIQIGNVLDFFDGTKDNITNNLIHSYTNTEVSVSTNIDMSSVDGKLVVADGSGNIKTFRYVNGTIEMSTSRVLTRDLWGVDSFEEGVDLTIGSGITIRPTELTDNHLYNLRNQGWSRFGLTWGGKLNKKDYISETLKYTSRSSDLYDSAIALYYDRDGGIKYWSDPNKSIQGASPFTGPNSAGVLKKIEIGKVYFILEHGELFTSVYDDGWIRAETYSWVNAGQYVYTNDGINLIISDTSPRGVGVGIYPSNADNVNIAMYPDPEDKTDRVVNRFNGRAMIEAPSSTHVAKGSFVIDVMNRGDSRNSAMSTLSAKGVGVIDYELNSELLSDRTIGGASLIEEYAGRVFYAGFSGTNINDDGHSPTLNNYVFYSQVVKSLSDISSCYQVGDPTHSDSSELLDTDGGFIKIDGAHTIVRLMQVDDKLFVFASNGVWVIYGGSDYGFTANNHVVYKVSDRGCISPQSVVVVDSNIFFCSIDGIYVVGKGQVSGFSVNNISQNTVQKIYDNIDYNDKTSMVGSYDSYTNEVKWLYKCRIDSSRNAKELIFNLNLQAFTVFTIFQLAGDTLPLPVCYLKTNPYVLNSAVEEVHYNGDVVQYNGDNVFYTSSIKNQSQTSEIAFLTITDKTDGLTYTVSRYSDESFTDWKSEDSVGVDAEAYILTGYTPTGNYTFDKTTPYIFFHFNRTETGYVLNGDEVEIVNQSSCLVQARWGFTDSTESGRWGSQFQAYRYKRPYIPLNELQEYNEGFEVVSTKNKVRGNGKAMSLYISSEPNKDLHILGWSLIIGVNGNV